VNILKILLVYPLFPDTFWSFKHALKFVRKSATHPPIGLLTVAAMLPSSWEKKLVDMNVTNLTDADLEWADFVFISAMIVQEKSVRQVVERCREKNVKTVAGGPLFTIEHERFEDIDHFVLNEAEITLPEFLADLENGCLKRVYRTDKFADITKSPIPMWKLADLKRYACMNIQYSRGCPFQCDFCSVTALLGHKFRTKTPDQIIAELNSMYKAGFCRSVLFVDDNLIGNRPKLKRELLPALIEWQKNHKTVPFTTEVSIDMADDDELMKMMSAAGFVSVFIGVETPDEESLTECNKKQNQNRDLVEDVRKIQRAGMQVQAGFIVGFDNDKPSIFQRQIDFIQKCGIVTAMVGILQAPPGTGLYKRLMAEGRLIENQSGDNADGTTNIVTRMNLDTLYEGYQSILNQIYSPENYYARIKTFLRNYKPSKINNAPQFNDFIAFIRANIALGIVNKGRRHYWGLLFWTIFKRPKLMPLAVTLAVYGHHFRKIIEMRGV
jgi:radical SAM superfamily enzyme YgiQ (UPF0313 family)